MRSYLILFSLFITNLLSAQTIRDATLIKLANGDTTFISQVSTLRAQFPDSTSARNVPGGIGVYWKETNNQLVFKSLIAGSNITITSGEADSTITISSTGGSVTLDGEVNGPSTATTVDTVRRIWFDRTYNQPDSIGKLQWDANEQTLQLGLGNTTLSTVLDVGQETLYPKVINNTSAIIKKGTPVMVDTVGVIQGDNIRVRPAIGSTARNVSTIMGVAVHDIGIGETGFVTWFGHVTEVNHTDIAQTGITLDTAQILYLSSTEPGKFTNVIPTAPNLKVPMAIVIRKPTANNMTLLVRPQLTPDIHDVNDVSISSPTAGQVLRYNSGGFWENGSPLRLTIQEETSTLTQRDTLRFIGSGITATDVSTRTNVSLDNDLNSLANLASTGYVSRVATDSFVIRSFSGGSEESSFASIGVGFGDGVSGNTLITVNTNNSTFKRNVVAATTGNITLSGLQSVDGITLTSGNRVLVWQQTDQKTNGIYSAASGAWTRTTDLDSDSEINRGVLVYVEKGIQHDSKYFVMTTPTDPGIVIGTSNINFQQSSIRDVLDGDKGDITVSGNGTGWSIDNNAITNVKIANDAIDSTKIADGKVGLNDINSGNATNGQVLKWNGSNWRPGADDAGGVTDGDKGDIDVTGSGATWTVDTSAINNVKLASGSGGIYKGSGDIPNATAAKVASAGSFTVDYNDGSDAIKVDDQLNTITLLDGTLSSTLSVEPTQAGITSNGTILNLTEQGVFITGDTIDISGVTTKIGFPSMTIESAPANTSFSGVSTTFTANEAQVLGDLVYINSTYKAQLGDADTIITSRILAMCTGTVSANNTGTYLMQGFITNNSWSFTQNQPVFLSLTGTSGNTLTQTAPTATNDCVVHIGVAVSATRIYFNPSQLIIELE